MFVLFALLIFVPNPAQGHDIPDERVDRGIQILLDPPRLRVFYEVSLTEWTLYQDLKRLAPELAPGERFDRIERYAQMIAPLNARGLLATVDDTELSWQVETVEVDYEEHPLLRFHFRSDIPPQGNLLLQDTNFSSSYGTSRLALQTASNTWTSGYDGPSVLTEVEEIPLFLMSDEEEQQSRSVTVDYRLQRDSEPREELPPSLISPGISHDQASVPSKSEQPPTQRLQRLFWNTSGRTLPLLLMAAFVMGAAHAIQPGHGKSAVVGAALQGPQPLVRGLLLAGSAAAAHLLLAVCLAVVAVLLVPSGFERIDVTLTRTVGLILAIIGAWRIGATFQGSTALDDAVSDRTIESSRDAVLSGLAIGAIPCWDAVLLLAIAWIAGRVVLGVALLVAFSLGASATLLGIALTAGLFRSLSARLNRSSWLERTISVAGGLLLSGIGAYLFFS